MTDDVESGTRLQAQACVVGGGPAGMMLGYLLARAGIETIVLEKHGDFLRDFRGDTVHPSTLRIMDELGLLERFLQRPHDKLQKIDGLFGTTSIRLADMSRLNVKANYIAFMPQWEFLDFLMQEGKALPKLKVMLNAECTDLTFDGAPENGRVTGVIATTPQGPVTIAADLTIGCDGRHSTTREKGRMKVEVIGAPIDVLWFRVAKQRNETDVFGRFDRGKMIVTLDRGDYWQCAYVIGKGTTDKVKAKGIEAFRESVASLAPQLRAHIDDLKSFDDVKLLTVAIDRLQQWSRPGLLCIGDAAHAMSPVGGVGINLAIQDAVATANILADTFGKGPQSNETLDLVRQRRLWPTKVTQGIQIMVQNRIITPTLQSDGGPITPPLMLKLISMFPVLQGLAARVMGLGVRPEHVQTPDRR